MIQLTLSITLVCSNIIIIDLMLVMIQLSLSITLVCKQCHHHNPTQCLTIVLDRMYDPVVLVNYFSV